MFGYSYHFNVPINLSRRYANIQHRSIDDPLQRLAWNLYLYLLGESMGSQNIEVAKAQMLEHHQISTTLVRVPSKDPLQQQN